ncbi:MAG: HAD superfamily hydrolase (TIGR01484 family) [Gammaproteobacteria bacterium]|jgi:HAD superfamily hydrolase (TIGR01484 family)
MNRTPTLLLCTDLDRTLIPNGIQAESPCARARFCALVKHPEVALVYVSGRNRKLIEQAIFNYRLPQAEMVVSDVGTNIYEIDNKGWRVNQDWQAEITPDWSGYNRGQLHNLLNDLGALRIQAHSKQNTYKLSYYVPLHVEQRRLDAIIRSRLHDHAIEASLVWSIDEPAGVSQLDILPLRATKLHAIEFICATLGVALGNTVFAGDSGNDLPVLTSNVPAVLVANALPKVAQQATAEAQRLGNLACLYLANGSFLGMNGNYAAGILEGVAHYYPEMVELFAAQHAPQPPEARQ